MKVGDIILLKEPMMKQTNYPMAIVQSVTKNDLDEVTEIKAMKGSSREIVSRHITSIIPILSPHQDDASSPNIVVTQEAKAPLVRRPVMSGKRHLEVSGGLQSLYLVMRYKL